MIKYLQLRDININQVFVLSQKIFKNTEGVYNLEISTHMCTKEIGIGAFENNILVGYIFLGKTYSHRLSFEKNYTILSLAVDNNYRNRNIGYNLLNYILYYHKGPLYLEVRVSNIIAQKLYTKIGFKIIGILPNYYLDEDAYWMQIIK